MRTAVGVLAIAFLLLTSCTPAAPAGPPVDVRITNANDFSLHDIALKTGATVKWTNDSAVGHTVTFTDSFRIPTDNGTFNKKVDVAASVSRTFANAAGTVTDVVLERADGATVLVGHPNDAYEGPRKHAEHCAIAAKWLDRPVIVDGLVVYVEDIEAHHAATVAAGARLISGLETNPLQRQYRVEDLEGHRWMFARRLKG